MQITPTFKRQTGFTLFEMTLAMVVVVFTTLLIFRMQKSATDDLRAKNTADSMLLFVQGAQRYLDSNRAALVAAMRNGSDAANLCKVGSDTINDTSKHTCAVDTAFLKGTKKILPDNIPDTNNFGQTWVAIYRLTNPSEANNEDVEILVVASGGEKIPSAQSGLAAQLLGGIGGFVPDQGAVCSKDVCGAGGWAVNLADFGAEKQ